MKWGNPTETGFLLLCALKGNAAKLTWGKPHQDTRLCYPKFIMGSDVSRSNTHVANASGVPIRVYYSVDRMRLEEVVQEVQVGGSVSSSGEASGSVSSGVKLVFKPDSRIRYLRIPVADFGKISGEGAIYVSVFVESCSCSDHCLKTISENFHIPSDRSFIVTENHNIRFQKYGASIWVDEQGIRHG
ncbi:hypothetical protein MATL_G00032700 [Megalops atlanticus]|uniref:Uncharacterized protein n=1 Tax=Megalops atlanticus TaxID=7932 RepID=A0A9D3TCB5_MEGAT|nr:hypothetical protein MATL_G00032700 [Megalops atlanticus]